MPAKLDLKTVLQKAKKYNSRKEFMADSRRFYKWLSRNKRTNYLDKIFPKDQFWDLNSVIKKANECESKARLIKDYAGAYAWFIRNKKLTELNKIFPVT